MLRTDGKRRHLELVSGTLKGSETINSTGHSLGINPAGDHHSTSLTNHDIKYHSTPLHLPPLTKFNRRKRKNKMKRNRIHPKSYDEAMSSSNTSSLPIPSTDITSSQLSTDTTTLSCSLPSLLTSQHRKGGSRASINTDWSSNGGAELERCLPQRQLGVFIGTWNMAKLNVRVSHCPDLKNITLFLCTVSSRLSGPVPVTIKSRYSLRVICGWYTREHIPAKRMGDIITTNIRPYSLINTLRLSWRDIFTDFSQERSSVVLLR